MPFDLDKDMVAALVNPFGIAALQADSFDDVEFSCALSKEDACRLPGCGEDLGGDDFQVVMQNIGGREMYPFRDSHIAVVGNTYRLADRDIGLRQYVDRVHHERIALPVAD